MNALLKHNTSSLGADLRALRKMRSVTLADLSAKLGRSVGWLSQVERNISEPSISDLQVIAKELSVPLSIFFGEAETNEDETGYVVRAGARRKIGSRIEGLIETLLSPDLTDDFEVVHSTFTARACMQQALRRPTQEVGFLVSGRLDIWIDGRKFCLSPGDSFRIRGEAYQWANPYKEPAVAIWVIAPPVY